MPVLFGFLRVSRSGVELTIGLGQPVSNSALRRLVHLLALSSPPLSPSFIISQLANSRCTTAIF